MAALHLTTENFRKEVLEYEGEALVDFWAPWCGPCQMVGPIVEEIAEERKDVKVCKVNVDEQPDIAGKYNVMSIPTIIVFKKGEPVTVSVGAKPKAELLALLAK
ncbi:MAG: thioredoxin [Lachnospiraceae bacterium]|nr:thioredoxin [Lachnospiraceae bacterium]